MATDTHKIREEVESEMPPIKKPFRARSKHYIRAWREYRNLTQQQLADRMETTRETVSRIENGNVPYNQDFIEQCAVELGYGVIQLRVAAHEDQGRILAIAKTLIQNNG